MSSNLDDVFRKFAKAEKKAEENVDPKELLTKQVLFHLLAE